MRIKKGSMGLILGMAMGTLWAGSTKTHSGHGEGPVLPGGHYSAKAKALTCGGCAEQIEKTLKGMPAIQSASVEPKTGQVDFVVKEEKTVEWAALQKALRAASDKMGMGADYSLSEFQIIPDRADNHSMGVQTLSSGYYTAKIGAITCGGCGPTIEKTMGQVPGIGAAQVDAKAGTVRFAVLVNKEVSVANLQKALGASADQMGMGADYTLIDIKKVEKGSKQGAP